MLFVIFVLKTIFSFCSGITVETFDVHFGYRIQSINGMVSQCPRSAKFDCAIECVTRQTCKSFSLQKQEAQCDIHSTSPFQMEFMGDIISNMDWNLYVLGKPPSWITVAKFSSSSGGFEGDFSYELWNNTKNSMNNDSCVSEAEGTRCNRHYVQREKDWLLDLDFGTKVKVSLYDGGVEAAWVIFDKHPGSNDTWFQPSRVIDSYPWDTELLRSSSEMSLAPQELNNHIRFYVVESNPSFPLKARSAHSYWMKLYDTNFPAGNGNQCEHGTVYGPQIFYSKSSNPTLLSKSQVSIVVGETRNTLNWADAETFCETHLHVPIATQTEVENARVSQPYECCMAGWMAGQVAGWPMNKRHYACGNRIGFISTGSTATIRMEVYCKPDQNLVGVADTMVISVNV